MGAGKSSLLMAIAAEMRKTLGKVTTLLLKCTQDSYSYTFQVFVADVQDGFGLFTQVHIV